MKIKIFAWIMILSLLLGGCASGPDDSNPAQQPTGTEVPTEAIPDPVDFKINGVDLESYTIVWAESEYTMYQKLYSKYLPKKDMNEESAERLQAFLRNTCGIELEVISEKDKTQYQYEIYVGAVTRNELFRTLALGRQQTDSYRIAAGNDCMYICGGAYGTTWHALDDFETQVKEQLSKNNKVSFEEGFDHSGEYHLIKIGMVGDSITQGSGSSTKDRGVLAYPNQIGRILWKDCLVYNYGQAGRTLRDDHKDSYMASGVYPEALHGAREMDIMTIMLGTNDADRFMSANGEWTAADDAKFIASCEKLVKSFYDRNNNLKFFLFKSPHCFRLDSNYVAGLPSVWEAQEAAYDELKNKGYDMLGFLDVAEITKDLGLYFSDGLHPNDPGHKMMAEAIAEYLQGELLDK